MRFWIRLAGVLAGMWAGVLACIGAIVAPAAFGTLLLSDAGRLVARVFELEAGLSVGLSLLIFLIERQRGRAAEESGTGRTFTGNLILVLGALFCTIAGYYAVKPMMDAVRAGQGGPLPFGALHAISSGFFVLKGLLVLALAWRLTFSRSATS